MTNPKCVLLNETYKLPWDFEIQIDHLISARRTYLEIVYKKRELAVPANQRVKLKESKKRNMYLDPAKELK